MIDRDGKIGKEVVNVSRVTFPFVFKKINLTFFISLLFYAISPCTAFLILKAYLHIMYTGHLPILL